MEFRKSSAGWFMLICCHMQASAQELKTISLKNEQQSYVLKTYFISQVKDDRLDTTNIGSIRTGLVSKKTQKLQLEHGARQSLTQFIRFHVQQDTTTIPIELHITDLSVSETGTAGLRSSNELNIALAFYEDRAKLTEYKAGGSAESTGDASKPIEELIRGSLENILEQFDNWWSLNKAFYQAQKTKPAIMVEPAIDENTYDSANISYSPARPLTFDDFQGRPDEHGNAAAVTSSMLSVKYSTVRTMSNLSIVDVSVLANFSKRQSWFRSDSRRPEILAHEQRHFDLTAAIACELVDTIRHFTFTLDHYTDELHRLQRLKQIELEQLQDQFDLESKQGTVAVAEKWNRIIHERLNRSNCYKH